MSQIERKSNPWLFFDNIRCINLITRNDRYEESKKFFDYYNIPVNYYRTSRHPNGGIQGCFESHISILKEAYRDGAKTCLIFEDDVIASNFLKDEHLINDAISFMKNNPTWELFYLGTCPEIVNSSIKSVHGYNDIFKMNCICTHAYVVSASLIEKAQNWNFTGVPIDYLYLFNTNAYGIYPSLFYQKASASDISGSFWNLIPCKHYFFRLVELYARYINKPLKSIMFVFILCFILLLILYLSNPASKLLSLLLLFILIFLILMWV